MSGSCFFYVHFIRHYSYVFRRGSSFPIPEDPRVMTFTQTLTSSPSEKLKRARATSDTQGAADDSSDRDDIPPNELDKPLPLSSVLTRPIIVTVANFTMVALLNDIALSYIPLVWSTPVEYGGLNLSPASIGLGLSVYGGMDGLVQLLFFPHLVNRFGVRRVFVSSILSCGMIYILFPFENLAMLAAGGGPNAFVWLLIILQLTSLCVFEMAFGESFFCLAQCGANSHGDIFKLQYTCTFHLLPPTSDRSAPRMALRKWPPPFRALLDRPLQTGSLRFP